MSDKTTRLYGWYSAADQPSAEPDYDPPHDAPCPYCGDPLTPDDVRTHSFTQASQPTRSYFYRTHRTCDDAALDSAQQSVFSGIIEHIVAIEGQRP